MYGINHGAQYNIFGSLPKMGTKIVHKNVSKGCN